TAIYTRNLRTQAIEGTITDLEAVALTSNFISKYYSNSKEDKYSFHKDFVTVFSMRPGNDCILSKYGCYSQKPEALAFSVEWRGGSGFNPIFNDSDISVGEVPYHITGLGINFGFSDKCVWGPATSVEILGVIIPTSLECF